MKREQQWECGGCGAEERWFLHSVRHRGSFRRLCTDCLLKNHQGLFCPVCLHVFSDESPPPPPNVRLMCLTCPSITHRTCADSSSSASFTCPPCSDPNFTFFRKKPKSDGDTVNDDGVDKDSAKALVAAAKIAAASMAKAAESARIDAEKRVKEAALAKKRAREALERVASLAASAGKRDSNNESKPVVEKPNGNSSNGNPVLDKAIS